jgi:hypothetical protein
LARKIHPFPSVFDGSRVDRLPYEKGTSQVKEYMKQESYTTVFLALHGKNADRDG